MLQTLNKLEKKIGSDKIILIGHSFGGFLASMYAIEFPNKVKSLVLVTPADVIKMPSDRDGLYGAVQKKLPEYMKEDYSLYLKRIFDFKSVFKKSEKDLVNETLEFLKYFNVAIDDSVKMEAKNIGGWMPQALYLGMGAKHDYSKYLKEIKTPTLIVCGTDDIIKVDSVQDYIDNIPNSTLKTIAGTHVMFYDNPIEFEQTISKFLSKN